MHSARELQSCCVLEPRAMYMYCCGLTGSCSRSRRDIFKLPFRAKRQYLVHGSIYTEHLMYLFSPRTCFLHLFLYIYICGAQNSLCTCPVHGHSHMFVWPTELFDVFLFVVNQLTYKYKCKQSPDKATI